MESAAGQRPSYWALGRAWFASTHHKIGPSCYCGSGHLPQSHKERPCWRSTFPRRRRCGASGVESVDHTSTRSQMTSNAMDMPRPAPFDTFVPPPISAASFIGKVLVWQTSISIRWIPLVVIFAVADALISSEERLATTRLLE